MGSSAVPAHRESLTTPIWQGLQRLDISRLMITDREGYVSLTECVSLQLIRTTLLDLREKEYEREGLGSSYLFRVDEEWAVQGTKKVCILCGNTCWF